jgi:hypothetical protein
MDALTYGLAASLGPAVVGVVVVAAGPFAALGAAAASALVGAALTLALPAGVDGPGEAAATRVGRPVTVLFSEPGLFRTMLITAITAIPLGAVPLVAVATASQVDMAAEGAAGLVAAFGAGNLLASLALVLVPLRGEADRLVRRAGAGLAVTFALGLLVGSTPTAYVGYALIGAASGVLFTASLAARTAYAPQGATGQVFVSMAGLKIACSSSGTVIAGAALPLGSSVLFAAATTLALGALVGAALDPRPAHRGDHPGAGARPRESRSTCPGGARPTGCSATTRAGRP